MSRVANGSNNRASSAASFPRYLDTTALLGQSVHLKWVGGRNSQGQTVQGELMLGHRKNGEAIFLLRGKTPDINYVLPGIRDLKGAEQAARRLIKTERNLELSALPEQHAALPELRPYRGKLAGHEVNAEPLHTDNGKTTWRITVSSKGKDETLGHFDIRLPSAPLSAQHFTNGTPLKNRLLKFIHEHQPRVQVAGVKANNGRPAERIAGGLTASILNEQTGVTTTVRLPLYKRPDQGFLGLRGYYTIVRGECIELPTAASPEAAQGRGHELIERLLKQGRIDPKSMSVSQTHRIVTDSKGQKRAVPLANQTARDGALMFDAYVAADLSTEKAPKGTKAFVEGWNQRRGVINAARALQVATTILAVAGSVPLRRPLVGTNVQTPRTQPKPTGTIEVSLPLAMSPVNGGRTPQQPRPVGPPVALCPSKNTVIPPRKLTDAAIDVQATTVSSTVIPPRAEIPRRPGDAVVRAVDYLRLPARAGSPSSSSNTVGVTGRNNTPSAALAKRSTGGLNASPTQLLTTGSRNSGSKPLVSHRQRTPVPQQGRSSSLSNFHGTPTEPNTLKAVGSTPNVVDLMPRPLPLRLQLALTQLENSSDNMPALTSNTAATVPRSSEGTGQLTQPRQDFHNSSEKAIPFVQELLKVKNLSPAQIDLVLQRLQQLPPSDHQYIIAQLVQALAGETQDNESDRSPILLPVLARYWARGDKKLVPILERVLQGRDEAGLRLLLPDAEGKPGEAVIQALISARALQLAGEKSKPDYVIALGHILRLQLGLQSDQDVGSQVQWLLNLQNSPDLTRHIRLSALKQLQDDRDRRQVTAHTPAAIGNVTQLRSASGSGTQQPPRPINNQDWQEMGSLFLPRGTSPSPAITKIRSASNISELNSRLDKLRENPGFKIWLKKPETLAEIEKSLKKIHGAGYSESSWLDLGSDVLQARLIQHLEAGTTEALLENWLGLESDQTPEHLVKLIEDKPDLLHALVQTVLQPKLEPKWLALGAENLQKLRRTLEMLLHSGYNQRTLERSANRDAALHGAISQSDRDHPDAVGMLTRWVSTLPPLVDRHGNPLTSRQGNIISHSGATGPQQAVKVPNFDWRDFGIHGTGTQVHIADAHGNYGLYREIIRQLAGWGVRNLRLSQLGDLINKGWDGEACVRLTISLSEIAQANGNAFPSSVTQRYQEKDPELLRALQQLHSNGLSFVPHAGNHEQIAQQGAQGGYARHLQAVDPADVPGYLEKITKWMKVGGRSTVVSYIERYATADEATYVRDFLDNLPSISKNSAGEDVLLPEEVERVNRFSEIWLGVLRKAGHLDFLCTELSLGAMEGSVITTHGGAQLSQAEAKEFLDYAKGRLNSVDPKTANSLLWQRPFGKGNVAELYAKIFGEDKVIIHGHTPHANHMVSYDPNTGVVVIGADLGFTSEQVGFVVINNGQIALGAAKRGPSGISVQPVSWDSVAGTGVSTLSNRVTEVLPGELFEKKKSNPTR